MLSVARCGDNTTGLDNAFAVELRRLRAAARLSLRDLATTAQCDYSNLSRLERGERRASVPLAAVLDRVLCGGGVLVALAEKSPIVDTTEGKEGATDRRTVLTALASAGMSITGLPVTAAGWQPPRRIGHAHVQDIIDATSTYRGWIARHGGAQVRAHAAQLLERAAVMHASTINPTVRAELLVAIGDLAALGAYIARDIGAHREAGELYQLALTTAAAAQASDLRTYTVVRMAGHHLELRQPGEVLRLVEAAAAPDSDDKAGGTANRLCITAWAHAQRGDADAAARAVDAAEDAFAADAGRERPDRPWAAQHVTEAELHSLIGAAYVDLARIDPRHAQTAAGRLGRALELRGPSAARNRTLDLISMAEAQLALGEIDHAAHLALDVHDTAQALTSARLTTRLQQLTTRLAPHARTNPTAAQFMASRSRAAR